MKRIVLLVLLVILALPGLFGLLAADHAPAAVARSLAAQGATPAGAPVRERQWFVSRFEQRFFLADGGLARLLALATGADAARELVVSATVRHGPFPGMIPGLARADTVYRIVDGTGAVHEVPATSRSRVSVTGRVTTDLRLEPLANRCRPGGGCLDSGGGRLQVEQAVRGTPWSLTGGLEALSLSGEAGRIAMDELRLQAEARATAEGPQSGEGRIRARNLVVSAPNGGEVNFESVELASTLDVGDGRLSQSLSLDAPRIVAGDGEAGALRLLARVQDLDAATIHRLGKELADTPADQRPARAAGLLSGHWESLAVHGPSLVVEELRLENAGDALSGALRLGLPAAAERSGKGLFGTLYQDLHGRLDLTLSEGMIRTISESDPDQGHRLAALISLGYLELRQDAYRMQAEYAGRVLTVNGRPLPLPALPAP